MKVKNRLALNILLSVLMILLVAVVIFVRTSILSDLMDQERVKDKLIKEFIEYRSHAFQMLEARNNNSVSELVQKTERLKSQIGQMIQWKKFSNYKGTLEKFSIMEKSIQDFIAFYQTTDNVSSPLVMKKLQAFLEESENVMGSLLDLGDDLNLKIQETRFFGYIVIALICLIFVALMVIVWGSINHYFFRLLDTYITGIQEIHKGDMLYQIPVIKEDEFGEVTRTFNRMVSQLRQSYDKLSNEMKLKMTTQTKLIRLNRLYSLLSRVNEFIIRAASQEDLLKTITGIIMESGLFKSVWIELKSNETGLFQISSFIGLDEDELVRIKNQLELELVKPSGHNVLSDKSICYYFPIYHEQGLTGVLYLLAGHKDKLSAEEDALFIEIAGDIAFALRNIEVQSLRIKAETALKEREALLTNIINTVPDGIIIMGQTGRIIFANAMARKLSGFGKNTIVRKIYNDPDLKLKHIDGRPFEDEELPFQDVLRTGKSIYRFELAIERKKGKSRELSFNIAPLRDADNEIIGVLGVATDITERNQVERALRISEQKFSRAFHISPDSININRMKDGVFIDINEGFTTLTGYERHDVIGKKFNEIDIWVDRVNRKNFFRKLTASGQIIDFEARFKRKDGKAFTGLVSAKLIEVSDEPCVLAMTRDITERKLSEEKIRESLVEKEILLKEIHHRVKNNLQIIYSLLNLQERYLQDKDDVKIFQETKNRVKSMAMIHEKLYQSKDLSQIHFGGYVESLVSSLFHAYGIQYRRVKVSLDLMDIYFKIDIAIPCGLLLNELVSNSLKHGFPGGREGTIWVELKADGKFYNLTVRDDGVGLPRGFNVKKTESLGLQLVDSLIKQLSAKLTVKSPYFENPVSGDQGPGCEFKIRFC